MAIGVRKEYTGAAAPTKLATAITDATTSITVATGTGTGYPTGATGQFVIAIDRGTASEEKILCDTRSGDVFTVATAGRGFDGTSATSHQVSENSVEHVIDAESLMDFQGHIYDPTRDNHSQYVAKSLFDANTVLAADVDDTPAALTMATSTILARLATGNIKAATPAEIRTLLDVLTSAEVSGTYVKQAGGDTITASAATVIPLVVKGAASQTANLLEARDSAGTLLSRLNANGALFVQPPTGDCTFIQPGSASGRPLIVRGAASQTANLAEFQDSAGAILARFNASGALVVNSPNDIQAYLNPTLATSRGLVIRGAASQTANLAEFQNSAGTVLLSVGAGGVLGYSSANSYLQVGAGGTASALPAQPVGYIGITVGGTFRRIAYYG